MESNGQIECLIYLIDERSINQSTLSDLYNSSWRGMNVCAKFHGNPILNCWDILLKARNVTLPAALEVKSVQNVMEAVDKPTTITSANVI